jgi:hypothetical protein
MVAPPYVSASMYRTSRHGRLSHIAIFFGFVLVHAWGARIGLAGIINGTVRLSQDP